MSDFDLPALKREQLRWTKIQVQSMGHRMRAHLPTIDVDESPFCLERRLRDVVENHELNRNPRFYLDTIEAGVKKARLPTKSGLLTRSPRPLPVSTLGSTSELLASATILRQRAVGEGLAGLVQMQGNSHLVKPLLAHAHTYSVALKSMEHLKPVKPNRLPKTASVLMGKSGLMQSVQSSAQSKSIVSTSSASSCVSTSCLHPGQLSQLLFGDITTVDISSLIAFALTSDGTASALFENSIAPAIVTGQAGLQKPASVHLNHFMSSLGSMPSLPFEPSASRARASDEAYEYLGEGDDDDEGEWDTHVHHPPSVYVDNMKEKRVHSMDTASLRLSVSDSVIRYRQHAAGSNEGPFCEPKHKLDKEHIRDAARRLEHATPESSAALGVMRELFAGKKKVKAPPQREGKGKLSSLKLTDSGGTPSRQAAAGVKAGALRQPRPAFPSTLHPISRAVSSEVLVITPSTTEDTDERGDVEGRGDGEAETVGPDVLPAPLSAGDGTAPAPLEWSF